MNLFTNTDSLKQTYSTEQNTVPMNSRRLARTWPYPRHSDFVKSLRKAASDWFRVKGFLVQSRYPFILSGWEEWPKNIVLPQVVEFIRKCHRDRAAVQQGFPLHKYIHHGLSSQAFLFNLMGPLITRNDLEPLKEVLESKGLIWPGNANQPCFEYEDREIFNEDSGQPTSIDLVIQNGESESSLFIECKLVEPEFGGCSVFRNGDCDGSNPASDFSRCYLHHLGRRYWTLLEKHGFLGGPLRKETSCVLASHYQFFREVLFAVEKEGTFILLSDERSPTFFCDGPSGQRGLFKFLLNFVPVSIQSRIGSVSVQDLVASIKDSYRHPWIEEFEKKYGMN